MLGVQPEGWAQLGHGAGWQSVCLPVSFCLCLSPCDCRASLCGPSMCVSITLVRLVGLYMWQLRARETIEAELLGLLKSSARGWLAQWHFL